ncbi:hypothetical protein MKY95_18920 [Paenibacillus sp. FSL P4-0176]|uniref:hypothetical protein n=1 Tax=Paenibacillus sp. FSL P4-0176 TaxID=2921631 RepID=UPI0030CB587B
MSKTREEIVQLVTKKKNLTQKKINIYCLTHTHDTEPREYWVKAPYSVNVFNTLVAYIQFELSDIEQSYGMDQEDLIKILEQFYDCKQTEKPDRGTYFEIDLYYNWEYFCSAYDDVQKIESMRRLGLKEALADIVERFYQTRPEWRPKNVATN